jgi:hypothetical protein
MRRWRGLITGLAVTVLFFVFTGVGLAASGTLDINAPWGPADQDPSDSSRVEVTYTIKASGNVSAAAISAVQDAIDEWNDDINGRESDWTFDLVPLSDATATSSSGSGPPGFIVFSHNPNHSPPGQGGDNPGGGGSDDSKADIEIQIKNGGGVIAGSAQSTFENGFRTHVKIQISGSSFGLANDTATVNEIALHELGHGLGLGHHSNQDDLMGTTVGYEGGGPSACDLDGFEASHQWLVYGEAPSPNDVDSIVC